MYTHIVKTANYIIYNIQVGWYVYLIKSFEGPSSFAEYRSSDQQSAYYSELFNIIIADFLIRQLTITIIFYTIYMFIKVRTA